MWNLSRTAFLTGACLVAAPTVPNAPAALRPPAGQVLIAHFAGKGKQIYTCQKSDTAYAWKLKAPDAQLFSENGTLAGHHFAGPTWESVDNSRVVGKLAASVPSPDPSSIPWLLLSAKAHEGTGVMSKVQTIQRLNTKGGVAPATGCDAASENHETDILYEADYYFYAPM
jgi:hypothetical protein